MNEQLTLNGSARENVFRFGGSPSLAATGERIAAALERLAEMLGAMDVVEAGLVPMEKQSPPPQEAKVDSPYLNAAEAVAYLRLDNVKQLYGLIERGKLKPLSGYRKLRFTKEMLDDCMRGE